MGEYIKVVVSQNDNKKAVISLLLKIEDSIRYELIQKFATKSDFTYFAYLYSSIPLISIEHV